MPDNVLLIMTDQQRRDTHFIREASYAQVVRECRLRLARWMREKGDKALRDYCVLREIDRQSL